MKIWYNAQFVNILHQKQNGNGINKVTSIVMRVEVYSMSNKDYIKNEIDYCVIGGLAVNAYVEPVVSLDLDMIIATTAITSLKQNTRKLFKTKTFQHSLNLTNTKSDLRIQIQTDARYQSYLKKAKTRKVLGYEMRVAALEDILQGKIWAYLDEKRRPSKRQKDLADIFRLREAYPHLSKLLPDSIKSLK